MEIRVLDGARTVGGTKIVLSDKGETVLLDFGLNYYQMGLFYEEFLQPRSARGLTDLWVMGLIPRVGGLYRQDLQPSDFKTSADMNIEPSAVVLSHAHADHFGMIGTLNPKIPIVCSATTAVILKAVQDSGRSDIWNEVAYTIPKVPQDQDGKVLKSGDWRNYPAQARPLVLLDGGSYNAVGSFWNRPPNPQGRQLTPGTVNLHSGTIGSLKLQAFEVCHSIPGCRAIEIETTDGLVVYTGDLRFHGHLEQSSRAFVRVMTQRKPTVFICEGTRLGRKPGKNVTEAEVARRAHDLVRNAADRLVIADFGTRHVERLSTFLQIAESTGRSLVLSAKDFYLLQALKVSDPTLDYLQRPAIRLYDEPKASRDKWEEEVRATYATKMVGSADIKEQPASYILAFSFWDANEFVDLQPNKALYIYSSSEAYNEDSIINLKRLWNWLMHFQMDVHGFRWNTSTGQPDFEEGLNASGHLSEEDLRWMLGEIKPTYVLPVHTPEPEQFEKLINDCGLKPALPQPDGRVLL
jgi:ribonuclease J